MWKKIGVLLVMALAVGSLSGCVKVVKIGEEGLYTGKTEFHAGDSVSEIWDSAVADIEGKAVDLNTFLEEANGELDSLVDTYGKYSMGTSGTISYAVKGIGVVDEVNQESKAGYMTVKLDGYDGTEIIKIQIGDIYKGSSTRDTLDIISFGDYTNQEEWAAVSQELHNLIDTNLIEPLDLETLVGKTVEFTGTFTVDGNDEILITTIGLQVGE